MKRFLLLFFMCFFCFMHSTYSSSLSYSYCQDDENYVREMQKKFNEKWKGKTKHDLLISIGAPKSITNDGDGGEILTFESVNSEYIDDFGNVKVIHRFFFYVDSKSVIYFVKYQREISISK